MNKLRPFALFALAACAFPQDARQIVEEAQRRSRAASQRYEGLLQVISPRSRVAEKRWRYDRIGSHGDSKAILRFTHPPEVKDLALLIHNHKDRASDQWLWTPATQRDRRVALQDRSTRFFGTDFTFEDLEERDVLQYDYRLLGEESIDGHLCWKIESRPVKTRSSQYTHSYLWVRKDIYVFVRMEGWKDRQVVRRIAYRDFEQVKQIWTARLLEVHDLLRDSRTIMKVDKLDYNVPMKEEDFTLQALRRGS